MKKQIDPNLNSHGDDNLFRMAGDYEEKIRTNRDFTVVDKPEIIQIEGDKKSGESSGEEHHHHCTSKPQNRFRETIRISVKSGKRSNRFETSTK